MEFILGRVVYQKIEKEECLYYLFKHFRIFVIHKKYEKALNAKDTAEIAHLFNLGRITCPISENSKENEQVFYGDLKNLKQWNGDNDIDNYIFFKGIEVPEAI